MKRYNQILSALAVAAMAVGAVGCSDDDGDTGGTSGPDLNREYVQIERLGNPLVSEVFLAKRNHGAHNASVPSQDRALYEAELEAFVTGFGRPQTLADALSGALLPDMLTVDSSKGTGSAGWLQNVLANGYGGRRLTDDVVDGGLSAIFGTLVVNGGEIPSLTSDNVNANDKTFGSSFPYLATPHTN